MSDEPHASHATRRLLGRVLTIATSLPAMAFLACALLVDALLLPSDSTCCLLRGTPSSHRAVWGVGLVRTEGTLHVDAQDWPGPLVRVGSARVPARIAREPCFWAPTVETARVDIFPILNEKTTVTDADLLSIGNDLADRGEPIDSRITGLLRQGGGFERRPLPLGYLHNTAAAAAALLLALGLVRAAKNEFRAQVEFGRVARGQCPYCGYSKAGRPPDPCPECGGH